MAWVTLIEEGLRSRWSPSGQITHGWFPAEIGKQ